ncbi:MAG: hypothetical protein IKC63_07670 [Clostridia bacterium]|nr:hypothetical protein [Clostridia bacterium]
MDPIRIIRDNLSSDRDKLTRLIRRYPNYADDTVTALLGVGVNEASDEALELAFGDLRESLTAKNTEVLPIESSLLSASDALLSAEIIARLLERATIESFLPTLDAIESKCAYFRNAYSDEAFRIFKAHLTNPTVSYTDSPTDACREVYSDLATFAILPISSSREGKITGIVSRIESYELAPALFCEVSLPGSDETMRFGLYAASPIAVSDAEGLETVFYSDSEDDLSSLILAADRLGCTLTLCRELGKRQGFENTYRLLFRRKKGATANAVSALRLLLLCVYPHHQLCGIFRTVEK